MMADEPAPRPESEARNIDGAELRRLRERLRDSEKNVAQILDSSPVGISISTVRDGFILDMNDVFLRILGFTRDEVIGRTSHELGLWVSDDQRDTIVREFRERGTYTPRPVPMRRKDGDVVTVLFSASPLVHGDEPHTIAWVMDITDRLRAEQALRASEARWRSLVENAPVGIMILDRAATVLSVSRTVSGRPAEEYVGKSLFSFLGSDVLEQGRSQIERVFAEGVPATGEYPLAGPDGSVFWFQVRVAPFPSGSAAQQAILVATDITARRREEEARLRMEAEVHQARRVESLGVLAGGIAHDFNNLLAAILGNAEMALAELPEGGTRQLVEQIQAAGQHAADLTRQMLAYTGRGAMTMARLDLSAVAREMAQLLAAAVPKKIGISLHLGEGLPAVEADVSQMRQVVMNLVLNGADAIGEGEGRITVTTGSAAAAPGAPPDFSLGEPAAGAAGVFLEVADTGAGIERGTLPKIFDPFFTTRFAGRGLGLAAVQGIVLRHGGAIEVRTGAGAGSSFRVRLPAAAPAAVPPPAAAPLPPPAGAWRGSGEILLVDDEEQVRRMVTRMLTALGFRVLTAGDGREAVDVAAANPGIRAVLLDLMMPRMDGRETVEDLRRVRGDLPVILCSGYHVHEAAGAAAASQFSGLLQKPYRLGDLARELRRALGE